VNGVSFVPDDFSNAHRISIEKWVSDGGSIAPEFTESEFLEKESGIVRAKRDSLISGLSWRYERYVSEVRLGLDTTDSIVALDEYAQLLRDITEQEGFPSVIEWPEAP
jgi:hypothetical protein